MNASFLEFHEVYDISHQGSYAYKTHTHTHTHTHTPALLSNNFTNLSNPSEEGPTL